MFSNRLGVRPPGNRLRSLSRVLTFAQKASVMTAGVTRQSLGRTKKEASHFFERRTHNQGGADRGAPVPPVILRDSRPGAKKA